MLGIPSLVFQIIGILQIDKNWEFLIFKKKIFIKNGKKFGNSFFCTKKD